MFNCIYVSQMLSNYNYRSKSQKKS